jgi:hypothetical protein
MLTKASILYATRKSIVEHCCTSVVAIVVLQILARFRDVYPFNYLLLFAWTLALFACIPPACLIILANQGAAEKLAEETSHISINDLSREKLIGILKYCWPNSSSVRDKLMGSKNLLYRSAMLTLSLSVLSVALELQFSISSSELSSSLAIIRSAISCWWCYTLLCGLRFGGYDITEGQHRSATAIKWKKNSLKTSHAYILSFFCCFLRQA